MSKKIKVGLVGFLAGATSVMSCLSKFLSSGLVINSTSR